MGSIFLAQIALVLCGITVTEVWMTFISWLLWLTARRGHPMDHLVLFRALWVLVWFSYLYHMLAPPCSLWVWLAACIRSYPSLWIVAHCCLAACIGPYAGLGCAKVALQPASVETLGRSILGHAGLRAPAPTFPSPSIFSSTTTRMIGGGGPFDRACDGGGGVGRARSGVWQPAQENTVLLLKPIHFGH
jgi:hypothetical protein